MARSLRMSENTSVKIMPSPETTLPCQPHNNYRHRESFLVNSVNAADSFRHKIFSQFSEIPAHGLPGR